MLFQTFNDKYKDKKKIVLANRVSNGNTLRRILNVKDGKDTLDMTSITVEGMVTELMVAYRACTGKENRIILPRELSEIILERVWRKRVYPSFPQNSISKQTVHELAECLKELRLSHCTAKFTDSKEAKIRDLKRLLADYEKELMDRGYEDYPMQLKEEGVFAVIEELKADSRKELVYFLLPWLDHAVIGNLETNLWFDREKDFLKGLMEAVDPAKTGGIETIEFLKKKEETWEDLKPGFVKAYGVANEVKEAVRRINDPAQAQIFYPNPSYLPFIRAGLEEAGIPYEIKSGTPAGNLSFVRVMTAALECAGNGFLFSDFEKVVNQDCVTFEKISRKFLEAEAEGCGSDEEREKIMSGKKAGTPVWTYYKGAGNEIGWGHERYIAYWKRVKEKYEAEDEKGRAGMFSARMFAEMIKDYVQVFYEYQEEGTEGFRERGLTEIFERLLDFAKLYTFSGKNFKEKTVILKSLNDERDMLKYAGIDSLGLSFGESMDFILNYLKTLSYGSVYEGKKAKAAHAEKAGEESGEASGEACEEILGDVDEASGEAFEEALKVDLADSAEGNAREASEQEEERITDLVLISPIRGLKVIERQNVFVLGMSNKYFTLGIRQSPFLSDEEKQEYMEIDEASTPVDLAKNRNYKRNEDLNYSLRTMAEGTATFLYSSFDTVELTESGPSICFMELLEEASKGKEDIAIEQAEGYEVIQKDVYIAKEDSYGGSAEKKGKEAEESGSSIRDPFVISSSGIQDMFSCPYVFYYNRVCHIPKNEPKVMNPEQWLPPYAKGNMFHRTAEKYMAEAFPPSKRSLTKEERNELFQSLFEAEVEKMKEEIPVPNELAAEREIESCREVIKAYLDWEHDDWQKEAAEGRTWQVLGCELDFKDLLYEGKHSEDPNLKFRISLNGSIDRADAYVDDTGTLQIRIIDYKTGDKTKLDKKIGKYLQIQHYVYAMAILDYVEKHQEKIAAQFVGKTINDVKIDKCFYEFPYSEETAPGKAAFKRTDVTDSLAVVNEGGRKTVRFPEDVDDKLAKIIGTYQAGDPDKMQACMDELMISEIREELDKPGKQPEKVLDQYCKDRYCRFKNVCRKWVRV